MISTVFTFCSNHLKLTQAESILQAKLLLAKSNYESDVRAFTIKVTNKIYNYIKSLSRHDTLPPTMYLNSIPALSDSEKAFYSIFSFYFPPFVLPPMFSLPTPNSTLNNIDITEKDVHEALCTLDLSKASEPDGISQKILQFCSTTICGPILYPLPSVLLSTQFHRNGESTVSLPSTSQMTEIIFRTIGPYFY